MALWRTYLSEIHAFSSWQFSNTGCHLPGDYILKWKRKQWDTLDKSTPDMLEMPGYWDKVFYDHFQTAKHIYIFCKIMQAQVHEDVSKIPKVTASTKTSK
jgi:hypothetical protein